MTGTWVVDVTDETFERDVLERSRELPVVVDFWAEWCGPCRVLGPTLEKLAGEYAGKFLLAKVDTDRAPQLAQVFGIRSIPTVIAFQDGKPAGEFSGALPEDAVRDFIERLTPSEADVKFQRADAIRADDPEGAAVIYREVLEESPSHDGASVGLAEVLHAQGKDDEAREIVERLLPAVGPYADRIEHLSSELSLQELRSEASEQELRDKLAQNPEQPDVLLDLGKVLAADKRYPEALELLYRAAAADRELARGEAKELMVEIFHVVGVRSELADDYRTRLSRLLY